MTWIDHYLSNQIYNGQFFQMWQKSLNIFVNPSQVGASHLWPEGPLNASFLSNSILCCSILSFGFKGTLFFDSLVEWFPLLLSKTKLLYAMTPMSGLAHAPVGLYPCFDQRMLRPLFCARVFMVWGLTRDKIELILSENSDGWVVRASDYHPGSPIQPSLFGKKI